jgi:hypothetical protein
VTRLNKEQLDPYFQWWDSKKEEIEKYYNENNRQAVILMEEAIINYSNLLLEGGDEINERNSKTTYRLLPLNGNERFEFIKEKIASHYAFVQLDALFIEVKKKAARLAILQKNRLS